MLIKEYNRIVKYGKQIQLYCVAESIVNDVAGLSSEMMDRLSICTVKMTTI